MKENRKRRRNKAQRKAWSQFVLYRGTMAVLFAVLCVSVVMILGIVVRSVRTKRLNDELAKRRAQAVEVVVRTEETPEAAFVTVTEEPTPPMEQPTAAPSIEPTSVPTVKSTTYHRASGTALSHMETLYYENRDLIGWIEIPQVLDLPVMYRDNTYYLTHDFYGKQNTSGTLFLDVNHRFGERAQNLLLHGHNMKDGSMFGRLVHYIQDIDYYRQNAFISYDTLWEEEQYVVFSVMRVSLDVKDENFFDYFSHATFDSDEAFDAYVRQLQLRSVYAIPVDVSPGDALLTLSTCMDDERLVITCRRVREGESKAELRKLVNLAMKQ